ncbi:MAG: rRNA maturation RNase YbeY [Magnetococcales bacterium]|nr:rRNA maturation RNase YbeY [Magnetococcales bacterium]
MEAEKKPMDGVEVGIQLTDDSEIQQYNRTYRGIDKATNVLSFALMDGEEDPFIEDGPTPLGDILLAYETIVKESTEQNKPFLHHVTHLVVHGTLHLLGYDHERSPQDAQQQEAREVAILAKLNLPNPYG